MSISTSFLVRAEGPAVDLLEQAIACFDAACAGRLAPSDLVDAALPDPKGGNRRMAGLKHALDTDLGTPSGVVLERVPEGARIRGQGAVNLQAVAEIIRLCCRSSLPMSIAWVSTGDEPAAGWIAIHPDRCTHGDVASAASREIDLMAGRKEPSDLQRKAAESYATVDDGMMLCEIDRTDMPVREALHQGGDGLATFIYGEMSGIDDDEAGREEGADLLRKAARQLEEVACSLEARR